MAGIAARGAEAGDRRLPGPRRHGQRAGAFDRRGIIGARSAALRATGAEGVIRLAADQCPPRRGIVSREQRLHRHIGEIGVAVEGFAIGEGQLHRLGHGMGEFGADWVHPADIEAFQ
jgi:hypothetical protein